MDPNMEVVNEEEVADNSFLTVFSMILATVIFIFIWYYRRSEKKTTSEEEEKEEASVDNDIKCTRETVEECTSQKKDVVNGNLLKKDAVKATTKEVEEECTAEEIEQVEDADEGFLVKLESEDKSSIAISEESTSVVNNVASKVDGDGDADKVDVCKEEGAPGSLDDDFVVVKEEEVPATTTYEIDVKTGDVSGAGTDANVFVIIHGEHKDTGKIILSKSNSNKCKFERNQTDSFVEQAVNVGRINKIRIGHDNKGGFAGWYLDSVIINVPSLNCKWTFPADRWLDKKENDKKLEIDVYPTIVEETYVDIIYEEVKLEDLDNVGNIVHGSEDGKTTVSVTTDTKVVPDAAGVAHTQMVVEEITTTTTSEEIATHVNVKTEEPTRHGCVDETFVPCDPCVPAPQITTNEDEIITCEEVPEVESANDLLDEFLQEETVPSDERPRTSSAVETVEDEVSFENVPDVESTPDDIEEAKENVMTSSLTNEVEVNEVEPTTTTYDIDVETGDKRGAGTDANVFVILFGDACTTDKIVLKDSKTHKKMFERKQVDSFTIDSVDVGNISKIIIGHDNKGGFAGWYLGNVVINNCTMDEKLTFVADRWIDKAEADKKLEVELYPLNNKQKADEDHSIGTPGADPTVSYACAAYDADLQLDHTDIPTIGDFHVGGTADKVEDISVCSSSDLLVNVEDGEDVLEISDVVLPTTDQDNWLHRP